MILPVGEIATMHLLLGKVGSLSNHLSQTPLKVLDEVRRLSELFRRAVSATADLMEHQSCVLRHVERLTTEGYHPCDTRCYAIYIDLDVRLTLTQGVEDGNARKDIPTRRVDTYINGVILPLEGEELGYNSLTIDVAPWTDIPVEQDGCTAV